MKHIKYFENEPYLTNYKPNDIVLIHKPEWQVVNEPAIVNSWDGYYYRCTFLIPGDFGDSDYCIDESEILRKLTKEEIEELEIKINAKKYNL